MGPDPFHVTTTTSVDASHRDEATLLVERHMAGTFDSEGVHVEPAPDGDSRRAAVGIVMSLVADDEETAHEVRRPLETRFHWSLACADERELRYRFASYHGHAEPEDVPDELWAKVWPVFRDTKFWRDAEWVDDFVGDRIDWWLGAEEERSLDQPLREAIAAWEDV